MSLLDRFLAYLDSLPDPLLYLGLGLSAFVENLFPPIPGDTITVFGAFLVGTRRLDFLGVYLATTLGSLLGFLCLFRIGALLGRRFFLERDLWFLKARDILRAEQWFLRHGQLIVALNRYLPGARSVISLAAGLSGLRAYRVGLLALVSAGSWNLIWIWIGFTLGDHWETVRPRLEQIFTRYNTAILLFFGAAVLLYGLRLLRRRNR